MNKATVCHACKCQNIKYELENVEHHIRKIEDQIKAINMWIESHSVVEIKKVDD